MLYTYECNTCLQKVNVTLSVANRDSLNGSSCSCGNGKLTRAFGVPSFNYTGDISEKAYKASPPHIRRLVEISKGM